MNRAPTDADALIAALAETARGSAPPGKPEPEALLDYLAGDLSSEDEENLGRQLAADPEAARALLDLAELEAAGTAAGQGPNELAVLAGWQDLKRRLPPPAVPWFRRLPPLLSSVAAVLLVSTIGLGVDDLGLRRERNRPVPLVANLDLLADPRTGDGPSVTVAPGGWVHLSIEPPESCPSSYTATIRIRRDRKSVTRIGKLDPNDRGIVDFAWQAPPGDYELLLSGCGPRQEPKVYPFQVMAAHGG